MKRRPFRKSHPNVSSLHGARKVRGFGRVWGERLFFAGAVTLTFGSVFHLAGPTPSGVKAAAVSRHSAQPRFGLCATGGGQNCVVDGDTFWMDGVKIRVADYDTPETHPPRCQREAELGNRATQRLRELLNDGPFTLVPIERDEDRYGRKLRIILRKGASIGETLISEGLARPYRGGPRSGWCDTGT